MFDEYVSLGSCCEIAFQFRRVLGKHSSGFFAWNVTSFTALHSLLTSNFSGIIQNGNLTMSPGARLMHDSSHDFKFHAPFKTREFESEQDYEKTINEIRNKFSYFVTKFHENLSSDNRTAYFYRVDHELDAPETVFEKAVRLLNTLTELHKNKNFNLIIIQHVNSKAEDWAVERLHNRYLKRLAPGADMTDAHVFSWDNIFREFPYKQKMYLAS